MKTGINLLLWTPFVTKEHFGILEKLQAAGYDGAEIPLFGGEVDHYRKVSKGLKGNGLACTACTVMPDEEHNPTHRQGAVDYLTRVVDCCEALGPKCSAGLFISRWASSAARGRRQKKNSGPQRSIDRWPTMPSKPASSWP